MPLCHQRQLAAQSPLAAAAITARWLDGTVCMCQGNKTYLRQLRPSAPALLATYGCVSAGRQCLRQGKAAAGDLANCAGRRRCWSRGIIIPTNAVATNEGSPVAAMAAAAAVAVCSRRTVLQLLLVAALLCASSAGEL